MAPVPSPPVAAHIPPPWGSLWKAKVSANLTQVGYDAGLVIVNFSTSCPDDASKQKMRTVYGDFYTVLTRCDLGLEFTIAPASRGGNCSSRVIGADVDARICDACGCPFCVRDTNGSFAVGTGERTLYKTRVLPHRHLAHLTYSIPTYSHSHTLVLLSIGGVQGITAWRAPVHGVHHGDEVVTYRGRAQSAGEHHHDGEYHDDDDDSFDLETTISYDAATGKIPLYVNISHPLWVTTAAKLEDFSTVVDDSDFAIPAKCQQYL